MIKELCVESYLQGKEGELRGADRIELCENLAEGGTTPSYGTIKLSLKNLNIPVFVMIRPRGGDFCYNKTEIEIMKEDIKLCKELGVKGVVLGVLKDDKTIDYSLLEELISVAKPMEITFHKAIDEVLSLVDEVEKLEKIGINRILTSGGEESAALGAENLKKMIAKTNNLKIVVAGKVTKENLNFIRELIPASEFHGKKIV